MYFSHRRLITLSITLFIGLMDSVLAFTGGICISSCDTGTVVKVTGPSQRGLLRFSCKHALIKLNYVATLGYSFPPFSA